MALVREARAHSKYPWEYTLGELSSLFGIDRTTPLLTPGPFQSSGWIEAMKMLEQQLRFLSLVAWKREGNFNTNEGNISCLYAGPGAPSYQVDAITHSGGTLDRVRHWIDWIRSDYGLPAWIWSSDFVATRATARLNHVREMWYATGVVHESGQYSLIKYGYRNCPPGGPMYEGTYIYSDSGPYQYRYLHPPGYQWDHKGEAFRVVRGFSSDTRRSGVGNILLYRHGGFNNTFNGNRNLQVYFDVDISTADDAFYGRIDALHQFIHPTQGDYICLHDPSVTGVDGSFQYAVDNSGGYPMSGSGPVYCRFQIGDISDVYYFYSTSYWPDFSAFEEAVVEDCSEIRHLLTGAAEQWGGIYLWQRELVNPF